jgi:hypothetical protein
MVKATMVGKGELRFRSDKERGSVTEVMVDVDPKKKPVTQEDRAAIYGHPGKKTIPYGQARNFLSK